jgi:hypothetical protein
MFKNMSDADMEKYLSQAQSFMPGMPKMTPAMMRAASSQIGNMNSDQLKQTMDRTKTMASSASPSSNSQQ